MEEGLNLTQEQQEIIDAALRGRNLFITGSAGVGKSFTLNHLVEKLKGKHGAEHVFVTASTGIAGTHIKGTTAHGFAGCGTMESSVAACMTMAQGNGAEARWKKVKVLIIDEVSMLSGDIIDKMDTIASRMRPYIQNMPFGGIQLIVTGDFFQLPPVSRDPNWRFAFECDAWKRCNFQPFVLTRIFRQDHEDFVRMLQKIRVGIVDDETDAMIRTRLHAVIPLSGGIKPTYLYCTNKVVDGENDRELDKIMDQPLHTFKARDKGQKNKLGKNMLVPEVLRLKVGAQVMLLKNLNPPHLVNGSRGVVIGYETGEMEGNIGRKLYPMIQFQNGIKKLIRAESFKVESGGVTAAERIQVPLKLAWALTIHKSQGMTLDSVIMDISRAFGPGQAYVALSRCTCLKGMILNGYDRTKIRADGRVLEYYAALGDPMAKEALAITPPVSKRLKPTPSPGETFYKPSKRPSSLARIIEDDL